MKPNNYYYKRIAKKVDSTIDCDKFKSNVYYMRRIAIKHGGSYTNHRSSNKYLHDWAVALGYTYTDHEYNIKYLYDIAKYYDASTQANQTENHYLIIIHDNIVPPTPSQKLHEIDVELTDGKNTLSYADRTTGNEYATLTFTAKDEEDAPIPNLELSLDVTGEQTSTITTDSNGQYEITYNTQGIGDVEIGLSKEVDGILVSKTYGIRDAIYSDDMTSANQNWVFNNVNPSYSSDGVTVTPNAGTNDRNAHLDLTSSYDGDYEVSAIVTCTTYPKPFLCPYNCMAFVNNSHLLVLADMNTGYSGYSSVANFQDSNTMPHRFTVIGNTVTLYVNNVQVLQKTVANPSTIIQLWLWDNSYTIKDVLVMPL